MWLGRPARYLHSLRARASSSISSIMDPGHVISYKDLKELITSGKAHIIDVRSPEEVANGRIDDSVNIPLVDVEGALRMDPESFKMKYGVNKPQLDDQDLIFHCQMGRRGAQATEIAIKLGYTKARNYAGGYQQWSEKEGK